MPVSLVATVLQLTYIEPIQGFRSHTSHVGGIFASYFGCKDPSYTDAYDIFHHGATPKMVAYYADPRYCSPPRKLRNDVSDYVACTYLSDSNRRQVYDNLMAFLCNLPLEDQEYLRSRRVAVEVSDSLISDLFARTLWYAMTQDQFLRYVEAC